MILTDDNFATIERAIEEGRGIYENIRKSILFLLSSNLGEILTMFAAVAIGIPAPLGAGHILWINLITDTFPALALGMERVTQTIADALLACEKPDCLLLQNDDAIRRKEGMECFTRVLYGTLPEENIIHENGVKLAVDVLGGQKTGYFLDQKDNHLFVRQFCKDARVLDCFSYIGAFALNAAAAGAKEVTAVDISEAAVQLIEKNAALNGADCCIAVTKHDTETDGAQTELLQRVYTQAGCEVVVTSAATGEGVDALRRRLEGCVSAFSGASGVGKSSLMNALYPAFSAQVGEISGRIARGRNTTRLTELFKAGPSTYVADTPGFTMLDLVRYDIIPLERIHDAFPDLRPYMDRCRYRKCTHTGEDGCAVAAAVEQGLASEERWESFCRMYGELKAKKPY